MPTRSRSPPRPAAELASSERCDHEAALAIRGIRPGVAITAEGDEAVEVEVRAALSTLEDVMHLEAGWAQRGRAGVAGPTLTPVGEDGAHDSRVLDGGDDPQPSAASGASQDIEGKHAAHQRRQGPGLCEAGRVGCGSVTVICAVATTTPPDTTSALTVCAPAPSLPTAQIELPPNRQYL